MPALVLSVPLEGPTGQAGADAAEAVRLACGDIDRHGATTLATAGRLRVEDARFVPA